MELAQSGLMNSPSTDPAGRRGDSGELKIIKYKQNYIKIYLKDLGNTDISLYTRDKVKNQYWLAVIFGLQGSTALKTNAML